jgi:diguanylate cyclase (GGDEF)-like protein
MPVTYETDNRLKAIAPVLDEHAEWFSRAVKRIFYPPARGSRTAPLAAPAGFENWVRDARAHDAFGKALLDGLEEKYKSLQAKAGKLMAAAADSQEKPALEEFEAFVGLYEGFILGLRRVEQDCILAGNGIDPLSGLRSAAAMKKDLEKELERRARRGKPFCVVIARIDDYEHVSSAVSPGRLHEILQILGKQIKLCLRSFDDAYRLEDGEFLMSLKQTEQDGGSAAVERLRKLMAKENITILSRGEQKPMTMSYCVAEPLPGDTFDDLLKNMRSDLGKYNEGGNASFEFKEQSPLQRYVSDLKE